MDETVARPMWLSGMTNRVATGGRSKGAFFLTWGSEKNCAYETIPQSGMGGRVVDQHGGRAVGGSSTVNVWCLVARPT